MPEQKLPELESGRVELLKPDMKKRNILFIFKTAQTVELH